MSKNLDKKYYWLKLKKDFFTNKKMKKLKRIAGGDTLTIIYLKMQLLSLKKEGIIEFEGTEKDIFEQLEIEIDEKIDDIKLAILYLTSNNLIKKEKDNLVLLETIANIGSSTKGALLKKEYRKNKASSEKSGHLSTPCPPLVLACPKTVDQSKSKSKSKSKSIELYKDKDKEKNKKEVVKKKEYFDDAELNEIFTEYLELRKTLKCTNTERAVKLLLNKLDKLSQGDFGVKMELIENALMNSWKSFYPKKKEFKKAVDYSNYFN